MLHQLETSSNGALFRFARSNTEFYHEQLVALDGHIGLELPSEAIARFRRHGLTVESARPEFVWYFITQGEFLKRFDTPYARRNIALRWFAKLDRFLAGKRRLCKLYNLLFGVTSDIAAKITPLDHCIGLCVALSKK